jgi:hypothetical protein
MSFELSFSPEFFLAEGEPYDRPDMALNSEGQPTSVWSAIGHLFDTDRKKWRQMAREVFGLRGKHADLLMAESVLDKVQETNTCTTLTSPIEVWIDEKGDYRLKVYEG